MIPATLYYGSLYIHIYNYQLYIQFCILDFLNASVIHESMAIQVSDERPLAINHSMPLEINMASSLQIMDVTANF